MHFDELDAFLVLREAGEFHDVGADFYLSLACGIQKERNRFARNLFGRWICAAKFFVEFLRRSGFEINAEEWRVGRAY